VDERVRVRQVVHRRRIRRHRLSLVHAAASA
jgi:hypothetical protein